MNAEKFALRFRNVVIVVAILLAWNVSIGTATAQSSENDVVTNSIGMKLALIPAGKFEMGSPRTEPDRDAQETLHPVTITKPFRMGVYEVTIAEYSKVIEGTNYNNTAVFKRSRGGGPNHPMENVEWTMANKFCELLSARDEERKAGRKYRLPTEAEWEYACRAGTSTAFHFGDSLSSHDANFNGKHPAGNGDSGPYLRKTAKVGCYKPNAFGLYDMHGNVAEWCSDFYDPEFYADSPDEDPKGPPFGVVATNFDDRFFVVVRGGCWLDESRACRSAYRFRAMPATQYRLIGFRVVCEVEE